MRIGESNAELPLNASCIIYATRCQNFDFKLRRDHRKKISYERRSYESVDDGSLSQVISRKTIKKIVHAFKELAKLDLNRDSTLLLTVGGNDLFLKKGKCGCSEGLVGDFGRLIRTAKSKSSRFILVGIVPHKYR